MLAQPANQPPDLPRRQPEPFSRIKGRKLLSEV
jgi:hypothetical protein